MNGMDGQLRDLLDAAVGEPPRQVMVLFALTEVRLLAGLYGIDSVIKKDPDIVFTMNDVTKAQHALAGAPGSLRVIDEKTVYLRMPATFMESETALIMLRNLMKAAHERELKGEPPPAPPPAKKSVARATSP